MTFGHRYFSTSESPGSLRRRRSNGMIMGVCAGIADKFSLDRTAVRLVALLFLWFFTVPSLLLYLLLAYLGEVR